MWSGTLKAAIPFFSRAKCVLYQESSHTNFIYRFFKLRSYPRVTKMNVRFNCLLRVCRSHASPFKRYISSQIAPSPRQSARESSPLPSGSQGTRSVNDQIGTRQIIRGKIRTDVDDMSRWGIPITLMVRSRTHTKTLYVFPTCR